MDQQQASITFRLSLSNIRQRLLGISPVEASFARRGFRRSQASNRLEQIGVSFLRGYQLALATNDPRELVFQLDLLDAEMVGFSYEGAAMGLAILDLMTPWNKDRWLRFVQGGGAKHVYMAHVGAGWALARLQRWRKGHPRLMDPLLRWLAVDGYGFHEGYFHWPRFMRDRKLPERLSGYSRRVFDQGLGRSFWFVNGADVERIASTVATFPGARQQDLWSGVGLACTYAGGVDPADIKALSAAAPAFRKQLAQGACFAAKTRQMAANPAAHTEAACRILCGMSADDAAAVPDLELRDLPRDGELPAYEVWRQRIQSHFSNEVAS